MIMTIDEMKNCLSTLDKQIKALEALISDETTCQRLVLGIGGKAEMADVVVSLRRTNEPGLTDLARPVALIILPILKDRYQTVKNGLKHALEIELDKIAR